MLSVFLLALFLVFAIPHNAHAYLDPASGNALVASLIALAGTSLYMCKSLFYKIIKRQTISPTSGTTQLTGKDQTLVIFSEGKTYWSTFRPIVNELIKQKKHFRYLTFDVHDPALCIDSEFMHSKLYYKTQLSFAKLAKVKAPVMLATTPNIGSPGYPMKRPIQVGTLVHISHSACDVSFYRKGSLDYYDVVLMIGNHEKTTIRTVEAARQIKKKELVTCGLPYMDDLYRQKQEAETIEAAPSKINTTILVAPSWGRKGCFSEYGIDFVEDLSQAGFSVIIRPHPHSYNFEPDAVKRWQEKTIKMPNVVWDTETFGTQAMRQADILVSDTSGIRFDFAFLYEKPVISMDIPKESQEDFESDYLDQPWAEMISSQIGSVVTNESIDRLTEIVKSTLENFPRHKLQKLRDTTIANFGNSAPKIVRYLFEKIEEETLSLSDKKIKEEILEVKQELAELRKEIRNIQAVQ
jgi:hypothetical protein